MNFREFLDEVQKIKPEELRVRTESSLEVVASKDHLGKINPVLETYFGPAFKPQGRRPTRESDRYSSPYGGIRRDQTLYFREDEEGFAIAMLWPWKNGVSVTVKIIRGQIEESPAKGQRSFWDFLGKR